MTTKELYSFLGLHCLEKLEDSLDNIICVTGDSDIQFEQFLVRKAIRDRRKLGQITDENISSQIDEMIKIKKSIKEKKDCWLQNIGVKPKKNNQ